MPNGARSTYGDRAPQESPVLVNLSLKDAFEVTFEAVGAVNHVPGCPPACDPPEGGRPTEHENGSENGISNIEAPSDALLGVFLDDDRPDRSKAPKGLRFGSIGLNFPSLAPELKQVFYIGKGATKSGARVRFAVPKGATRLFLAVMDGHEWNNNTGWFAVRVTVQRTGVSSEMYSVDSSVSFAKFACMPERNLCTPERALVEAKEDGHYHVVLPAQVEWGASVPTPAGVKVTIQKASGVVCLEAGRCNGPMGGGPPAGEGFVAPKQPAGALVGNVVGTRTYFTVNDVSGPAFAKHEGYFEFDVIFHEKP